MRTKTLFKILTFILRIEHNVKKVRIEHTRKRFIILILVLNYYCWQIKKNKVNLNY